MAWPDFKGIWKIDSVEGNQRDVKDHLIAIGGSETAVCIYCIDDKNAHVYRYGGIYCRNCNTITGPKDDQFTISFEGSKLRFKEPPGQKSVIDPGSWTANDNLPWYPMNEEHGHDHG